MRTKANNTTSKKSAPAEATPEPQIEEVPKGERFSFPLTPEGKIDFSSMRDKSREKMKSLLSDPEVAQILGGSASPAAEVQMFHPAIVSGLYDMVGVMEATMLPMFFPKVPPEIFKQVFTYTPQEKELLIPPTTRVLNKYAASWMIKYQDEIALGTLLVSMTVAKVNAAVMLSKMQQAAPAPAAPAKDNVVEMSPEPKTQVQ